MKHKRFPIRIPHPLPRTPIGVPHARTQATIAAWISSPEGQAALERFLADLNQRGTMSSDAPGMVFG